MATFDIVLCVVVLVSATIGLSRGLVKEVLSLIAWVAALFIAYFYAPRLAETFSADLGSFRVVLAFLALFIVVLVLASFVQWLIGKLVETTGLSGTDRLLGFLFGSARGLVVCLVALIAMRPFVEETDWWQASVLKRELLAFEDDAMGWAREAGKVFDDVTSDVQELVPDSSRR